MKIKFVFDVKKRCLLQLTIAQNLKQGQANQRQFLANAQPFAKMVSLGNLAINW